MGVGMNNIDWLAILVLALFWFFGLAPAIFGERHDSYNRSMKLSALLQFAIVLFVAITSLITWAICRVVGMII